MEPFYPLHARMYNSGMPDGCSSNNRLDSETGLGALGDNNTSSIVNMIFSVRDVDTYAIVIHGPGSKVHWFWMS